LKRESGFSRVIMAPASQVKIEGRPTGVVRVTGTRILVAVRPTDKGDAMIRQAFVKVLVGAVLVCGILGSQALLAADSGSVKTGTIKSFDAKAKTFVLDREPRPMTMTVNDKTVITLDGKASTFEAAIKVDAKVSVTYTRSGDDRIASKVEVTSAEKKEKK
jgi:hypothetical protein